MGRKLIVTVILIFSVVGCKQPFATLSTGEYAEKLQDKTFVWHGPTARTDRIPTLHAARALAYIGDPAVPFLFQAFEDDSIDALSLYDALAEIGLPVERFPSELIDDRDTTGIEAWWDQNGEATKFQRSDFRVEIGLPELTE